jgi:ABC-type lipoprotein release transport system permease subunit
MRLFPVAFRNVIRTWRRTLITTAAMGFAGFIMIFYASLMEGLLQATERNAVAMNLGDIQIHAEGYRDDPDLYKRIENASELIHRLQQNHFHAAQRLYGFGLAATGTASAGVQLRGLDVAQEATVTRIHEHVMQGSWLSERDPSGAVIGRKLARILGVHPGEEVVVVAQAADGSMSDALFKVRGILKSVGEEIDRGGFFMLESTFRKLMVVPNGAHEIAVMREDRSTDLDLATRQVAALAPGYEVLNWRQLRPVVARVIDVADESLLFMLLITYVAVGMVVLNAMLMSVFERIHELGVMKALGVTPWQLTRLVYLETMVQVTAASVFALVTGSAVSYYYQSHGINLSAIASGASFGTVAMDPIWHTVMTVKSILFPIGVLFVISALAVIYPAVKAAVIRPVRAIHHR